MRILDAGIVLITAVSFCGCASLQRYPSFGTAAGGGVVLFDRTGAHNLLPASRDRAVEQLAVPETAQPIH